MTTVNDLPRAAPRSEEPAAYQPVRRVHDTRRSGVAVAIFDLLDPAAYGCFVTALIFDAVYARSSEVLWVKAAAWLIAIGLLFAIVPRFINLARVWFPRNGQRAAVDIVGFWLNLLAIVAAVWNAFVHSRDAYGVMPDGLWLSGLTVGLLVLAKVIVALGHSREHALERNSA